MISKACIVGIYQRKLEAIARRGVELLVLVPPSWRDARGEIPLERAYTDGYQLEAIPIHLNGNYHLHFYRQIGAWMRKFQPDIVHVDEEPYNLSCWQGIAAARQVGAKTLVFSWQNLDRTYPPPFSWGEKWTLKHADRLIAGTEGAAAVWRAKGYTRPIDVIAQFGFDPELFAPLTDHPERPFTIGVAARLVTEKGIHVLLRAAAQLEGEWRVRIVGGGTERAALEQLARDLGIADWVTFVGQVNSAEMPAVYHSFDVLTVPSLTRPNWKEQFGPRATVEAMASGVPVIGSDSGAIPDVIADAGLIVPEGDPQALADAIRRVRDDAVLRQSLAEKGRAHALQHYTHDQIAAATVEVYREMHPSPTFG